jgi:hypothetical protein
MRALGEEIGARPTSETGAGSRRATWSSSWRVTAADSTASPAATARTPRVGLS